jgi:uncharacterized protein YndB with AHSA1/START domain
MPDLVEVTEKAVLEVPIERVWEVISATNRYAEWVADVIEVTDHHGVAEIGRTYSERNRTIGPLTTRSTWTVKEIEPLRTRIDTGVGFAPMYDMTNVFALRRMTIEGADATELTYTVRYRAGLGLIGLLIDRLQQPGLRRTFQASMRNLEDLIIAEG